MMPIIILQEPQLGENIGAIARIMSNFAFNELRIVNPRDGWPNKKAMDMAVHGDYIIKNATIYPTLDDALSDLNLIFGSAAINRDMDKPVINPKQVLNTISKFKDVKIGFLFGRERSGLTNDELAICDYIIQIQTSELNSSLNIAQAVAIICYEYFHSYKDLQIFDKLSSANLVNKKDLNYLLKFMEDSLESQNFFKSPKMKPIMLRNMKNLFVKAQLTSQDINTLFGIFKSLMK